MFPVVLFGSAYWGGLVDWLREHALAAGMISAPDLDLFRITDDPVEACEIVVRRYEASGRA